LGTRALRIVGVVAAAVLLLAVTAVVVWFVALRDTAEPATVDEAVTRFRAEAAAGDTPAPVGVYVYLTTGQEHISALGGTTHRYPARTTVTVTRDPCGMRLRWDGLQTRSTSWTVCAGEQGDLLQSLDGWVENHVFFGQDDETRWECSGSPWLTTADAVGTRTSHLCDGGDTTQDGTVDVVGIETLQVAGAPVETLRVRLEAREDGAARGPLVEERWVELETGLPIRIRYRVRTENASPIGDVVFEERYALDLISLVPRR
jgi:hypothetical protein